MQSSPDDFLVKPGHSTKYCNCSLQYTAYLADDETLAYSNERLQVGHVHDVRMLPESEVDAAEEPGSGGPVDLAVNLSALLDLGEEFVEAADDGDERGPHGLQ